LGGTEPAGCHPPKQKGITMDKHGDGPKRVHVNAYTRKRYGRLEQVCEHWRSWPHQLSFGF